MTFLFFYKEFLLQAFFVKIWHKIIRTPIYTLGLKCVYGEVLISSGLALEIRDLEYCIFLFDFFLYLAHFCMPLKIYLQFAI